MGCNLGVDAMSRGYDLDFFETSLDRLQAAVEEACGRQTEWPARVAAGIYAALDFAVADPVAAAVLTVDARVSRPHGEHRFLQMIERLSELLSKVAPRDPRHPAFTDTALIAAVATVVGCQVRCERMDVLGEMASDLVYLVLLPRLGLAEAERWTQAMSLPVGM